ncbi:MAG: hypothetical protein LBC73_03245 [Oscillospiraceae bacterium]|jgi:hypothetical protein|nr:hypothetical protein [Oscillospiraceae bacterium]
MSEGYNMSRDMANDIKQDTKSADSEAKSDFGGDLAKNEGIDLNAGADVTFEIGRESTNDNIGEDLNDGGMDVVLDNFQADSWSDLSLDEQKKSMTDLADFVATDTGLENPPEIVFRDDMPDGSYGGYSPDTNTVEINQNMLDDNLEAADTIAHEMWHALQEQIAKDPNNPKAGEYQEAFDNYISSEYDFEAYQNQMIEAEARDYAQGFKDRLSEK